jgi:hypothetical protein
MLSVTVHERAKEAARALAKLPAAMREQGERQYSGWLQVEGKDWIEYWCVLERKGTLRLQSDEAYENLAAVVSLADCEVRYVLPHHTRATDPLTHWATVLGERRVALPLNFGSDRAAISWNYTLCHWTSRRREPSVRTRPPRRSISSLSECARNPKSKSGCAVRKHSICL